MIKVIRDKFIGNNQSDENEYKKHVIFNKTKYLLEIIDTKNNTETSQVFIFVYSIIDRKSFEEIN